MRKRFDRLLVFWARTAVCLLAFAACDPEPDPIVDPDPDLHDVSDTTGYFMYGLASIEITTDGKVEVDSKDPVDYRPCTVTVDGAGVFDNYEGRGRVRGRGNSTWEWYAKKPYRIKLDESSPFMGMAANRDWVLLADYRDVTHMMNNVGFTMAHCLGVPYTNHSRYATLKLNGKNMGLYMVTEQVERGGHRVDVQPTGILLALDINDGPGDCPQATNNFWSEYIHMAAAVKWPEDPEPTVRNHIRSEFGKLEYAILDHDWTTVNELLDVQSMIDYLIIQEAIANVELDNNPSARSVYINRDAGCKWVMGPVWDCDGGFCYNWGDMYDSWGWGHTYFEDYRLLVMGRQPYYGQDAYGSGISPFFSNLFGMPQFTRAFKARWKEKRDEMLDMVLTNIDDTYDAIADAMRADCSLWKISNYTSAGEVEKLKDWLISRFDYLDNVIAGYDEGSLGGEDHPNPENNPITVATIEMAASFPLDGHHLGTYLTPDKTACETIEEALGVKVTDIPTLFMEGYLRVAHNERTSLNFNTTASDAEGKGFWFNSQCQASNYGNDSSVYAELSFSEFCFILGKHPSQCAPGCYPVNIVLVYGDKAVQVDFDIIVTG